MGKRSEQTLLQNRYAADKYEITEAIRKLLGMMDMFVFLIVIMDAYVCENLSNGTLYVNHTSIKLLE